jgi:hypothetical protein
VETKELRPSSQAMSRPRPYHASVKGLKVIEENLVNEGGLTMTQGDSMSVSGN